MFTNHNFWFKYSPWSKDELGPGLNRQSTGPGLTWSTFNCWMFFLCLERHQTRWFCYKKGHLKRSDLLFYVSVWCFQTAAPDRPPAGLRSVFGQSAGSQHRLHGHQPVSRKDPVREPHGRHADRRVRPPAAAARLRYDCWRFVVVLMCVLCLCQECVSAAAGRSALRSVCRRRLEVLPEGRNQRRDGASDRLHAQGLPLCRNWNKRDWIVCPDSVRVWFFSWV